MNDIDATSLQQQLRQLRQDVNVLDGMVRAMKSDFVELSKQSNTLSTTSQRELTRMRRILFGDDEEHHVGLIEDHQLLKKIVKELIDERQSFKSRVNGVAWGLGMNVAVNGGILYSLWQLISGGL